VPVGDPVVMGVRDLHRVFAEHDMKERWSSLVGRGRGHYVNPLAERLGALDFLKGSPT
jgi:hypothetical protein